MSGRGWKGLMAVVLGLGLGLIRSGLTAAWGAVPSTPEARLMEAAGSVEILRGQAVWRPAVPGEPLALYDLVRTGPRSRAAIQLTDRSVVRLDQGTLFQILPPRREQALRRFRLDLGRLFFFHRERPDDTGFETPVATGAIRGTEFVLAVPAPDTTTLELLDGRVVLDRDGEIVEGVSGETIVLRRGEPVRRGPLVPTVGVQWALHYPVVVDPDALFLAPPIATAWASALEAYREGDFFRALREAPAGPDTDEGARVLRASLALVVGRVDEAMENLAEAGDSPEARAIRRLIATVTGKGEEEGITLVSASEWLAASYRYQSAGNLEGALAAARAAWERAPSMGAAALRVGELEFALERPRAAERALEAGERLSPRHPLGPAVRGWLELDRNRAEAALAAFDEALRRDAGYADAWMGRGLALDLLRRKPEAFEAFQAAAALDPYRSIARSYLAKAWAALGDRTRGLEETRRARALDASDPTPWLYSALIRQQEREVNAAVRDLEQSLDLNDRRAVLRSRLGLDRDRSMRGANLAQVYRDAGLEEAAEAVASRAVTEDYSNFAAHLFLAQSLVAREDPAGFDLRYETARQNELLLANLLAPAGAGNLSVRLSQQERLRYLAPDVVGVSSETTYWSRGAWSQAGAVFGSVDRLDYAVDAAYVTDPGWRANQDAERLQFVASAKQAVSVDDRVYLRALWGESETGDVARYKDDGEANGAIRVRNEQAPQMVVGWHHRWSPGHHTLILGSFASDRLTLDDPARRLLFVRQMDGQITDVEFDRVQGELHLDSLYQVGGLEVQQVWQADRLRVVAGGRYQRGEVATESLLSRPLEPNWIEQDVRSELESASGYLLGQITLTENMRLDAGAGMASLNHPENPDLPPFSGNQRRTDTWTPRLGWTYQPWRRGQIQAAYGRSLGGLFFDQSLRLEPARLAGFNQAFRSLIPESVVGVVPGTLFDSAGVRLDQVLGEGTYVGVSFEALSSSGEREVGAVSNSLPFPVPDTPIAVQETLEYREHNLSAYVQQLIGRHLSVGARYRGSVADLETRLPGIPRDTPGLSGVERNLPGTLQNLGFSVRWQHHRGWMAFWESVWWLQRVDAGGLADRDVSFWHHSVAAGYRWPQRAVELQIGIQNLTDEETLLHPMHLSFPAPPERTFFTRLRLNF